MTYVHFTRGTAILVYCKLATSGGHVRNYTLKFFPLKLGMLKKDMHCKQKLRLYGLRDILYNYRLIYTGYV